MTVADNQQMKENPSVVQFHVIGPNKMQNELLVSFLEDKLGKVTKQSINIDTKYVSGLDMELRHLFLIDCLNAGDIDPWFLYKMDRLQSIKNYNVVFYNVSTEAGIEKSAVLRGVHGVCYNMNSFKELPKALEAVLKGELWYSRKTLTTCLQLQRKEGKISTDNTSILTSREKEILIHIAGGSSNQVIADDLCISLYTVKTHIYKIYKKINVKNRLQASLWAAKYL